MAKKPVDWTVFGPCDTCLVDVGEQCIHLHTNELIEAPHAGREKLPGVRSQ